MAVKVTKDAAQDMGGDVEGITKSFETGAKAAAENLKWFMAARRPFEATEK